MSYIKIDSAKVIEACDNYLNRIAIARKERAESIINKLANVRAWNFKKLGYEKAYDMLVNNKANMGYQIPFDVTLYCKSEEQERAEKLLILARLGDPIMLSAKDTFIFK